MYDIVIKNGRVIDPSQNLDATLDVALQGGRVAQIAPQIQADQARVALDAAGLLVTPGLIDLHVHIHWGVSHYGIEPDLSCLAAGVTTAVDAGSSGGYTYPSLKRYIIDRSQTRLFAFLNIAYMGMVGDEVGELEDMRFINTKLALEIGSREGILGIKARMDRVGPNVATEPLKLAVQVSQQLGKPTMVHIGREERMRAPLSAILDVMQPGDIVTHMYHGWAGGIVGDDGRVRPEVWRARERGLLFDVGHGGGSFAYATAKPALAEGFYPDTISSDLHTYSVGGPVYDLPTTMSKFLHLGMSLNDVIARCTAAPAKIIGLADRIGTLKPGAEGDVTLLRLEEGAFPLVDCHRQVEMASRRLAVVQTIKGGQLATLGPRV